MSLPKPIERLWDELERVRADVLREAEGLSQRQSEWKPSEKDWSIGEILDHLTIAEIATGKLTSKLLKDVPAGTPFPADVVEFTPPPLATGGGGEAPEVVWPAQGKAIGALLETMRSARVRSRQSIERLAGCDPRRLNFPHVRFGPMDLGQWWRLTAAHDAMHLRQIREVKATRGFPA